MKANDYNCEDCCVSDKDCMQIIGYSWTSKNLSCDFYTMNVTQYLTNSNLPTNTTLTVCGKFSIFVNIIFELISEGGLNWKSESDSDCRNQISLYCLNETCSCPTGKYYDTINLQCCTYYFN